MQPIVAVDDANFAVLCESLSRRANDPELQADRLADSGTAARPDVDPRWPTRQLEMMDAAQVYDWFIPRSLGGLEWNNVDLTEAYIALSQSCLTSTFVLTQRVAAIKRICGSSNHQLRDRLIAGIRSGEVIPTVGISHLTTSRQHVARPVLSALHVKLTEKASGSNETSKELDLDGFQLDGFSPWVTGAVGATDLLLGAQLENGQQILAIVPCNAAGISIEPGFEMIGLTGTQTGVVRCEQVKIASSEILAGPVEKVLSTFAAPATGSTQSSALALGLARAAIGLIEREAIKRQALTANLKALATQADDLHLRLRQVASGIEVCSNDELRTAANSLVLRATQSALVAAKGAGYVSGHPAGRWCQEALFFLVWSCPQAVLQANLCELAGLEI